MEEASRPFDGKIAIVTGGTQGLGRAIATLLARRGLKGLVICGRNAEHGAQAAEALGGLGCVTEYVQADLGDVDQCRAVVAAADARFGTVDILVNAAALTDRGTILDTSPALFDRMFAINVRGPFFLMQETAKRMIRDGVAGTMVNILSMSSHGGQPFIAAYCASKGALATLTRNTGYALLRNRIRVNGLNIGWMDTPGEHRIQTTFHGQPEDWLAAAEAAQPFARLLKPDEVARAVAFLASTESGMMTGSVIDFDQSVLGCHDAPAHPPAPLTMR